MLVTVNNRSENHGMTRGQAIQSALSNGTWRSIEVLVLSVPGSR